MKRSTDSEQLDDLNSNGIELHKALKSLGWINRWLGNRRAIIKAIDSIGYSKPLRIIDLGCGGGDLAIAIADSLRKKMVDFSITGIDANSNTVRFAKEKCKGCPEINFEVADVLDKDFRIIPCDIVIISQFIYRLSNEDIRNFINRNQPGVRTAFIFSELERSITAIILFKLFGFLMPISKLAKQDGIVAIKRSYRKKEWSSILADCKISSSFINRVPFFRIILILFPSIKDQFQASNTFIDQFSQN